MNDNKTYCINIHCPFKDCDKHLSQFEDVKYDDNKKKYIKVASLDSVCRDYLGYLVDEIGILESNFIKSSNGGYDVRYMYEK